jgi:hypothetical protein
MEIFTSLDLQKRTGDIQAASARAPVAITHHGKPRSVMLAVEEYVRLKSAAGEPIPPEVLPKRAVILRDDDTDPLGYDTSDLRSAARRMAEDALSGRNAAAVSAELARVRRRYKGKAP